MDRAVCANLSQILPTLGGAMRYFVALIGPLNISLCAPIEKYASCHPNQGNICFEAQVRGRLVKGRVETHS